MPSHLTLYWSILNQEKNQIRLIWIGTKWAEPMTRWTTKPEKWYSTASSPNPYLLNPNQQMVLRCIQNNPGIAKKKLRSYTKLNRKTLSYSIKRLLEMKLIWKAKRPEGECYEYITVEKLRYEILNQLLQKLLSNEIDEETFKLLKKRLEDMSLEELRAEM